MSKKRGPNSPMESIKTKQKAATPAAVSTLGMAAVFSAVSQVFSGNEINSVVSDSDEDNPSQSGDGYESTRSEAEKLDNPSQSSNVWSERNLEQSSVRSPKKQKEQIRPLFTHFTGGGALRDEIEIEFNSKNGKKFTGSILPTEIKHGIYIDCLKFPDHENFDGCRTNYKGKLVATIKLIEPIDIDELSSVEYFDFIRTHNYRGKKIEETIGCKIRGIRMKQISSTNLTMPTPDDGRTMVKIEGCDYRIEEDLVVAWLSLYGKIESEMVEDEFVDQKETGGNNRTGNYSVLMTLDSDIPQLLPMDGRRIKIYHKGITKLCTKCFGKHRKSECKTERKFEWLDYVEHFTIENPEIPEDYYGRWVDLLIKRRKGMDGRGQRNFPEQDNDGTITEQDAQEQPHAEAPTTHKDTTKTGNEHCQAPTESEFDIPTTEMEYESMADKFSTLGITRSDLDKVIENRRTAFNKAVREFNNKEKRKQKAEEAKPPRKQRKTPAAKK